MRGEEGVGLCRRGRKESYRRRQTKVTLAQSAKCRSFCQILERGRTPELCMKEAEPRSWRAKKAQALTRPTLDAGSCTEAEIACISRVRGAVSFWNLTVEVRKCLLCHHFDGSMTFLYRLLTLVPNILLTLVPNILCGKYVPLPGPKKKTQGGVTGLQNLFCLIKAHYHKQTCVKLILFLII